MKVLVWIALLVMLAAAITHIEPEKSVQTVNIRLGERAAVNYPNFQFRDVYSRDIRKYPDETRRFTVSDICQEDPSKVDLTELSYSNINAPRPKKAVVFELDDIINEQSVADAAIGDERVYVAFRNGSVLCLNTKNSSNLTKMGTWQSGVTIEAGQFFSVKNGLVTLLLTDQKLFFMRDDGVVELEGYRSTPNFESVITIQDKYLAVAAGTTGIAFYEFLGEHEGVRYLETIGSTSIGRSNFHAIDLATDGKGTLFMLDHNFGLLMGRIMIQNGRVKLDMLPQVVRKRNCDNLVYNEGDIYMTCNNVYRYGVHTDSIDAQLPDPLFKVKELYSYGNMLVIMGENDYKIYHNDRLVDEILSDSMDKFLVQDNHYLAVNEWGVSYGNYTIRQPVISCSTRDPENEGVLNVLLTTQAECNKEYLRKRGIDLTISESDTCLYTTPVQLVFWQPKDLSLIPFGIMTILLALLVIILAAWMLLVKRREWQLKHALSGFHMPGTRSQYDVMVEQAPHQSDIVGDNKDKVVVEPPLAPATDDKKPDKPQEYDIGD